MKHLLALLALAIAGLAPLADGQEVISASVPPDAVGTWPLSAIVTGEGPYVATVERDGETVQLGTQWEPHLRKPDGTVLSSWLAVQMPAGGEPGEAVAVSVRPGQPATGAFYQPITPEVWWGLSRGKLWSLYAEGIDGGQYATKQIGGVEVVRGGPVEFVWRARFLMEPTKAEANSTYQLPHLGVVTMDVRCWGGVNALDVRVMWEGGYMPDPNAWALFDKVALNFGPGPEVVSLFPTAGMGDSNFGLVTLAPEPSGILPHSVRMWSLGLLPGKGAHPLGSVTGWGTTSADLPTALGVPLKQVDFDPRVVTNELEIFRTRRERGEPLDYSQGATSWRHPSGIGYGGGTGGGGIGAWPHYEWARANATDTLLYLTGWQESRMDRTRISMLDENGETWFADENTPRFNFTISPGALWGDTDYQTAWPSWSQDPFGFRQARGPYREATEERYIETMAADRFYGTEDGQHYARPNQALWPLVELYREPWAMLHAERSAAACIADTYHRGDPNWYTSTMLKLAEGGVGSPQGREFAWQGWMVCLFHAYATNEQRLETTEWMDLWLQAFERRVMDNGSFQLIQTGKELPFSHEMAGREDFYPAQSYQNMFVAIAAAQAVNVMDRPDLMPKVKLMVDGMERLAWPPDTVGPAYRYAVMMTDGTQLLDWSEAVEVYNSITFPKGDQNGITTSHLPMLLAAGILAGAEHDRTWEGTNASSSNLLPYLMLQD